MNKYVLLIDSLVKTFSIIESGKDVLFNYIDKNEIEIFNSIAEGDLILGYFSEPANQIKCIFMVQKVENNNSLTMTKLLDVADGVDIEKSLEDNLKELKLVQISDEMYAKLASALSTYQKNNKINGLQSDYLTLKQLAGILKRMYNNPASVGKAMAPHIFGLKYGKIIEDNNYSLADIVSNANLPSSYTEEIRKGLNIYKAIKDNAYGLSFDDKKTSTSDEYEIVYEEFESDKKRNRIIFGAPGTGKSFTLNNDKEKWLKDDHYFERVTFHPDYSYANFVGTYKPVPEGSEISYKYVPGPFIRVLTEALENRKKPCLLIIEEINRAQIAAVFGDTFQLLDRDEKGISEYKITTSEDLRAHLSKKLKVNEEYVKEIRIPSNMFIWASMNSADQGVFPMDTAFKRRWEFEYIGINEEVSALPETDVAQKWNTWREAINNYLTNHNINEDKLMGPFFISKSIMDDNDEESFKKVFKNKVIMYLFEDAGKRCKDLFSGCSDEEKKRYSKICDKFNDIGMKIFDDDVWKGIESTI